MTIAALSPLDYIRHHNLVGIQAGHDRPTFLNIWMVVVDDRIFARSWGLAEKSWFNTFIADPLGAIRCGDQVVPVQALIPADLPELTPRISQAYLDKYDSGANSPYAHGIIQPEHEARTMELVPLSIDSLADG